VINDSDEEVREQAKYYLICLDNEWKEKEQEVFQCLNPLNNLENVINLNDIDVIEQYIHVLFSFLKKAYHFLKANKEKLQNSKELEILSEASIKKFAIDNKLDKKPAKAETLDQEGYVPKQVEPEKEDLFFKYLKLFKEHPVFSEYGPLMMMCPAVVNLLTLI